MANNTVFQKCLTDLAAVFQAAEAEMGRGAMVARSNEALDAHSRALTVDHQKVVAQLQHSMAQASALGEQVKQLEVDVSRLTNEKGALTAELVDLKNKVSAHKSTAAKFEQAFELARKSA
jgi:predicted  nucleic acid-binding Zn-ribbon protein